MAAFHAVAWERGPPVRSNKRNPLGKSKNAETLQKRLQKVRFAIVPRLTFAANSVKLPQLSLLGIVTEIEVVREMMTKNDIKRLLAKNETDPVEFKLEKGQDIPFARCNLSLRSV